MTDSSWGGSPLLWGRWSGLGWAAGAVPATGDGVINLGKGGPTAQTQPHCLKDGDTEDRLPRGEIKTQERKQDTDLSGLYQGYKRLVSILQEKQYLK